MSAYVVGRDTIDLLVAAALTLPELGAGHPEPASPSGSSGIRDELPHHRGTWAELRSISPPFRV
jgi:hypothetical protein